MTIVPSSILDRPATVTRREALTPAAEVGSLRAEIDGRMRHYLGAQRAEYLRQPVFATLYDDLTEFACRPGKRLRSLLFLLAYRVFAAGPGPGARTAKPRPSGVQASPSF